MQKNGATALAQLTDWNGTADELGRLAVPLGATLIKLKPVSWNCRGSGRLAEQVSKEKETIRERASSLRSLAFQQDVPSEEAVLAARRRREDGWRLVQADWLEGARGGEDLAAFLAEFAPAGTLADAYAQSVRHADAVADRLRREADRVAPKGRASSCTRA